MQVHEFDKGAPWEDLKGRLSHQRRVFGFFHPSMPEEPLVLLHSALMPTITTSMKGILGKGGTLLLFSTDFLCEIAL